MTVADALLYLETLPSDGEDDDIISADVYIEPPVNSIDENSDVDSGDEETAGPDNLSRDQLLAPATIVVHKPRGKETIDSEANPIDNVADDDSSSSDSEDEPLSTTAKRLKYSAEPSWKFGDSVMHGENDFPWNPPQRPETNFSPYILFEKFFTDDLWELICEESIKYAIAHGRHSFKLDVPSLKLFISILLISGYSTLPRRPMYWEQASDTHNAAVASAMSRNRFDEILQNLHVADNNNLDATDKFAKVKPLLEIMNKNCVDNFQPEQVLSIDESMVPYYGRHGAKQYIRGKPIKFGFKMWVVATRLGYVAQFYPYQGRGTTDKVLGLGGSVVVNLLSSLPDLHYHIIVDNFFTNLKLLRHLKLKGIAMTGTIRANRTDKAPLPEVKIIEKLPRGTHKTVLESNAGICLVRWYDNKVVTVASTYTGAVPISKCKRFSKSDGGSIEINQPKAIQIYNYGMGGVDRCDQNLAAYMINHRSKKWWWPVFRFTVDLAVQKAFQLYRLQEKVPGVKPFDLLAFRRSIVEVYLKRYTTPKPTALLQSSSTHKQVCGDIRYDGCGHWIVKGTQRRCAGAYCRGTTLYSCEKCNVALHPDCFKAYHVR